MRKRGSKIEKFFYTSLQKGGESLKKGIFYFLEKSRLLSEGKKLSDYTPSLQGKGKTFKRASLFWRGGKRTKKNQKSVPVLEGNSSSTSAERRKSSSSKEMTAGRKKGKKHEIL